MESYSGKNKTLFSGISAFQWHLKFSQDSAALPAVRALIESLHPLLGSNHPEDVLSEMIILLVTISDIQREIGEFQASLDTSREALLVARELRSRHSEYIESCMDALACHARSLVDDDAYDDATALLREIFTSWDVPSYLVPKLGKFGAVHAHAAMSGRPSRIGDLICAGCPSPSNCAQPFWLSVATSLDGDDVCAWLLLVCSIMHCAISPSKALTSAQKSLTLMSQYYE